MHIPYRKTILKNGITTLTQSVGNVRSIAVGVFIQAGSCDENPDNNGISHFIEHMSFKETKARTAYDIVEDIESRGGHINAYTSRELTGFYARVLDTELETALDVLCDIVHHSRYPEKEIEREKSVIIEEIHDTLDTPQEVANDAFMEQMFPDHPYGFPILGSEETVTSIRREHILAYVAENYNAYRISVIAVGAVEHERVLAIVRQKMEDYHTGTATRKEITPADPREKDRILSRDIAQCHFITGRRSIGYTDERRVAYSILNAVLSAGMTSRLFQNIRERYGFAYTIYSFIDAFKTTGLFGVYVATDKKHIDTLNELIWKEFNDLKNGGLSEAELNKVKAQTKGSLVMGLESMHHRLDRMVQQHLRYNEITSIDESLKKIDAVTVRDIRDLAQYVFDEKAFHTLLLKPNRS
jgi:predicted Zn-dependent peptidase